MCLFVLFSSLNRDGRLVCVCVCVYALRDRERERTSETARDKRREEKMYNIISDGVYYVYTL